MKISVIVTVYNAQATLKRCLISVLEQSYQDIEVIIVDDGSNDGSLAICHSICMGSSNVRIVHQKNQGVSAARNRGLELVTGDYFMFVDADDFLSPEACAKLAESAKSSRADLVVFGYMKMIHGRSIREDTGIRDGIYEGKSLQNFALDFLYKPQEPRMKNYLCIRMIRTEIVRSNGLTFDSALKRGEDFLFLASLHFFCQKLCALTSVPLYTYCDTPGSITNTYLDTMWDMALHTYTVLLNTLDISDQRIRQRLGGMLFFRAFLSLNNVLSARAPLWKKYSRYRAIICNETLQRELAHLPDELAGASHRHVQMMRRRQCLRYFLYNTIRHRVKDNMGGRNGNTVKTAANKNSSGTS